MRPMGCDKLTGKKHHPTTHTKSCTISIFLDSHSQKSNRNAAAATENRNAAAVRCGVSFILSMRSRCLFCIQRSRFPSQHAMAVGPRGRHRRAPSRWMSHTRACMEGVEPKPPPKGMLSKLVVGGESLPLPPHNSFPYTPGRTATTSSAPSPRGPLLLF